MKRFAVTLLVAILGCKGSNEITADDRLPDGAPVDAPDRVGPSPAGADVHRSGSRLKMRVQKSEDGAQAFVGWRDTQLERDCSFGRAADGELRCLPTPAGFAPSYYADAACNQPLALMVQGCTPDPTVQVNVTSRFGCIGQLTAVRVLKVGAAFTGTPYIRDSAGACIASTPSSFGSYDAYVTGEEMPPSMFVAAKEELQ